MMDTTPPASVTTKNNYEYLDHHYSCRKWSIKPVETEEVVGDFIRITQEGSERAKKIVPHELNIRYGKGENQLFDLYGTDLPPESDLVVFLHGGYWQALSKESSSNLVPPLYKEGFKVLVVDYDLTPNVKLGLIISEAKDLCNYVLQLAENLGSRGVWLMGHSAGAHLNSALLDEKYLKTLPTNQQSLLKGMVLISGIYDIAPLEFTHINEAVQMNTLEAIKWSTHDYFKTKNDIKLYITVAKAESPLFHQQSIDVYETAKKAGNIAILNILEGTDHFTIIERLDDPDFELTKEIIKFIKTYNSLSYLLKQC